MKKEIRTSSGTIKYLKQNWVLYAILLPTLLYFVIFRVLPIANMRLAFFDYKAKSDWVWAGLKYFKMIFDSPGFIGILTNTLILSFVKYILLAPVYLIFAVLLSEIKSRKYLKYVQVISYLPHFLSWVVIAGIWISFLSPSTGAVNQIIGWFGIGPIDFMTNKGTIRYVLGASELWRSLGWDSIVFFTAILNINPSLYEAAEVDGASKMQIIWNIVLPALIVPMTVMFILNLGFFLNAGFDQVLNFTNDSVNSVIDILDTYIYRIGIQKSQYSLATAVGLLKGVAGTVLVFITHKIAKKFTGRGVW